MSPHTLYLFAMLICSPIECCCLLFFIVVSYRCHHNTSWNNDHRGSFLFANTWFMELWQKLISSLNILMGDALFSFPTRIPKMCWCQVQKRKNVPSQRWTILCQTEFLWNVYPASGNLLCKEEIFYIGFSKFSDSDLLVSEDVLYRTFLTDKKNMKLSMTSFTLPYLFWQQRRIIWNFPKTFSA